MKWNNLITVDTVELECAENSVAEVDDGYIQYILNGVFYRLRMQAGDGYSVTLAVSNSSSGTGGFFEQVFDATLTEVKDIDLTEILADRFNTYENPSEVPTPRGEGASQMLILYLKLTVYDGDGDVVGSDVVKIYYSLSYSYLDSVSPISYAPKRIRCIQDNILITGVPAGFDSPVGFKVGNVTESGDNGLPFTFRVPHGANIITIINEAASIECMLEFVNQCGAIELSWWSKEFGGWKMYSFDVAGGNVGGESVEYVRDRQILAAKGRFDETTLILPQASYADWCYVRDLASADKIVASIRTTLASFRDVRCVSMPNSHGLNEVSDVEIVIRWREEGWV